MSRSSPPTVETTSQTCGRASKTSGKASKTSARAYSIRADRRPQPKPWRTGVDEVLSPPGSLKVDQR
jgi:hypothetical protein